MFGQGALKPAFASEHSAYLPLCFDLKVVDKIFCAPIEEIWREDAKGDYAQKQHPQGFEKVIKELAGKVDLFPPRLYGLRRLRWLRLWFHNAHSMLTELLAKRQAGSQENFAYKLNTTTTKADYHAPDEHTHGNKIEQFIKHRRF